MSGWTRSDSATYTPIQNIFGIEEKDAFCPLDENFVAMLCDYIEELCRTSGLRTLMLDDELCLSARRGIEVFSEADTYPRNRFHVPAAYSELFDLGCKVSDDMDTLKYMYTYSCPGDFERGYVKTQIKNRPLHDEIKATFANKHSVGIRAYESIKKIQNADLPETETFTYDDGRRVNRMSFPLSQEILSPNALPVTYEG